MAKGISSTVAEMRYAIRLSAIAAVASLALAACAPMPPSTNTPDDTTVAFWRFDEAPGSTQLRDSGPHGIHGRIGRDVETGVRVAGATAHRFSFVVPDAPPVNPERLNTVEDNARLSPGSKDFAVTVRLRTTSQLGGNIVQKGQAAAGQYWKMEIEERIAYCLFRGSAGSFGAYALQPVDDGDWHTIRCERTTSGVSMWIDGVLQSQRSGATGRISNSWPLSIAGKTHCNQQAEDCDYFSGDIDYIRIDEVRVAG